MGNEDRGLSLHRQIAVLSSTHDLRESNVEVRFITDDDRGNELWVSSGNQPVDSVCILLDTFAFSLRIALSVIRARFSMILEPNL